MKCWSQTFLTCLTLSSTADNRSTCPLTLPCPRSAWTQEKLGAVRVKVPHTVARRKCGKWHQSVLTVPRSTCAQLGLTPFPRTSRRAVFSGRSPSEPSLKSSIVPPLSDSPPQSGGPPAAVHENPVACAWKTCPSGRTPHAPPPGSPRAKARPQRCRAADRRSDARPCRRSSVARRRRLQVAIGLRARLVRVIRRELRNVLNRERFWRRDDRPE